MIPLIRFSDWEDRLRTYLDRVQEEPFEWGQHDCALFAADCVKAMCGVDPAEAYRGTYYSARGAAEALRTYGAGTLLKTVTEWLGDSKSPHFAQRGDVVMKDRLTTGICAGRYSWFVGSEQGREGLTPFPTRDCRYAFSVPYGVEVA